MANKILIKRGLKANMPILSEGELGYPTDTRELFIGTGGGNVNIGGSHWYCGTAMSGTSTTTGAYSYSACPQVKVDDIYLNTSNGNVYACTTAGSGTSAKWTYKGNIKGNKGDTGAKGEKGANAATIVVAASDSKNTASADYICTGTDDQNKINAAIAALPSGGGKIVLLDGTYNISGAIIVKKANVTIEGMGNGTVLKRMYNDTAQWEHGIINLRENSHTIVKELSIDGNNSVYTNSYNKGIVLYGSSDNVLDNVTVYNERVGIIICGVSTHNRVKANIRNVYTGIRLYSSHYNTVSNCIIGGVSDNGIECIYYSSKNIIEQNHISDITNAGVFVEGNCQNNIVSNNTIVKGDSTLYSIYIAGTYHLVVNNMIPTMNYTDASSGTTNTFDNNKT